MHEEIYWYHCLWQTCSSHVPVILAGVQIDQFICKALLLVHWYFCVILTFVSVWFYSKDINKLLWRVTSLFLLILSLLILCPHDAHIFCTYNKAYTESMTYWSENQFCNTKYLYHYVVLCDLYLSSDCSSISEMAISEECPRWMFLTIDDS
jgi:hypothetical protein